MFEKTTAFRVFFWICLVLIGGFVFLPLLWMINTALKPTETFSGVDYDLGLQAVEELKKLFHTEDLIPYALRWILMHDAISAVIPGASKRGQVLSNVKAAELPALSQEQMAGVAAIYDKYIRSAVHANW